MARFVVERWSQEREGSSVVEVSGGGAEGEVHGRSMEFEFMVGGSSEDVEAGIEASEEEGDAGDCTQGRSCLDSAEEDVRGQVSSTSFGSMYPNAMVPRKAAAAHSASRDSGSIGRDSTALKRVDAVVQ